jgi:hypothetical protein
VNRKVQALSLNSEAKATEAFRFAKWTAWINILIGHPQSASEVVETPVTLEHHRTVGSTTFSRAQVSAPGKERAAFLLVLCFVAGQQTKCGGKVSRAQFGPGSINDSELVERAPQTAASPLQTKQAIV